MEPEEPRGSKPLEWIRSNRWAVAVVALVVTLAILIWLVLGVLGGGSDGATTTTTITGGDAAPTTAADGGTSEDTVEGDDGDLELSGGLSGSTFLAVKVDNAPAARPQVGLEAADVLIEVPVEGGITRFSALYTEASAPQLVGPVRSLRPVDADLLTPFAPAVYATGGQRFVVGAVEGAGLPIVTPDDSIAFQTLVRPAPHNVFVSPAADVPADVGESGPVWETGALPDAESAALLVATPGAEAVEWRFEDGAYVRYVDGEPFEVLDEFDGTTAPLTRDVVVLLVVNQKSAGYTDSAGADVPTFDVIGGGEVVVAHDGQAVRGSWFRASQDDPWLFTTEDGAPLPVPEGRVYLGLIPDEADIEIGR